MPESASAEPADESHQPEGRRRPARPSIPRPRSGRHPAGRHLAARPAIATPRESWRLVVTSIDAAVLEQMPAIERETATANTFRPEGSRDPGRLVPFLARLHNRWGRHPASPDLAPGVL